jgi:hypothetical protein
MKPVSIMIACLLGLAATGCGSDSDVDIVGKWAGPLKENAGEKFKIEADITSLDEGKQAATVTYPELGSAKGCSGVWVYQGQNGGVYKFDETITSGKNDRCFGNGTVSLSANDDDHLSYGWREGVNSSAGTLTRE